MTPLLCGFPMAYTFLLSFCSVLFSWECSRAGGLGWGSWSDDVLVLKKEKKKKKRCEFICMFAMCLHCASKLN